MGQFTFVIMKLPIIIITVSIVIRKLVCNGSENVDEIMKNRDLMRANVIPDSFAERLSINVKQPVSSFYDQEHQNLT